MESCAAVSIRLRIFPSPYCYVHGSLLVQFRQHVGLLTHATKKNQFGRDSRDQAINEDDDDDDDEAELTAEEAKEKAVMETNPIPKPVIGVEAEDEEPKIYEIDPALQGKLEAEEEAKEQRMDVFLNDPELSIKVFFSSYYKDKGLFWCEHRIYRVICDRPKPNVAT